MAKKNSYINFALIAKVLGAFIAVMGFIMLVPAGVSLCYGGADFFPILTSSLMSIAFGLILRFGFGRYNLLEAPQLHKREGYIIVSFSWIAISAFGALPFVLSQSIPSFTDAFFEAISGFTTTGATILNDIEAMPKGLLFWRSMTHWIGGIGIIVLSLAILPMLGIGGNNLFSAETTGPTKDKIHPRISTTAKTLCAIYLSLTSLQVIFLMFGEMNFYEAVCHSFGTVATGGFSTFNDSLIGASAYTQYVVTIFMFLAGINFGLYYFAVTGKLDKLRKNSELKAYALFSICAVAFFTLLLMVSQENTSFEEAFRNSAFVSTSMITTTGFVNADYSQWIPAANFLILIMFFSGASGGSTSGGIKIVRHVILFKNIFVEFRRAVHPRAIIPVKFNGRAIPQEVITNVLAFFFLYFVILLVGALIFSLLGYNGATAIGISASAMGNVGPGIDQICALCSYASMPAIGKWLMSMLMLIGRLELFTVLILFTPTFWKK